MAENAWRLYAMRGDWIRRTQASWVGLCSWKWCNWTNLRRPTARSERRQAAATDPLRTFTRGYNTAPDK